MFGSKRPGKRSIVGTKVCAIYDDQFYRSGSIQSVQIPEDPCQDQTYMVVFNGGGCGVYKEKQLIGPGFRNLSANRVKTGQTVYLTYNNREVKGLILGAYPKEQDNETPKYWMVGISNDDNATVKVKLEDIRLCESRKSARLFDQDTDYTRMADVNESKKKSNFIDVPHSLHKHSKADSSRGDCKRDIEMEVMDENMAALVLTSLSHNPLTLLSHTLLTNPLSNSLTDPLTNNSTSPITNSLCNLLSYAIDNSPDSSPTDHSCSSPNDSLLSQSAPSSILTHHPPRNPSDHCSHNLSNYGSQSFDFSEEDLPSEICRRTVYQCTWRGCKQLYNTCNGIEKHIRLEHLGPTDDSDHEEEFYYTEIEVSMDAANHHPYNNYNNKPNFHNNIINHKNSNRSYSKRIHSNSSCKDVDSNDEEIDVIGSRRKCHSEREGNNSYNPTYDHNYQKKAYEQFSASIPTSNPTFHHYNNHPSRNNRVTDNNNNYSSHSNTNINNNRRNEHFHYNLKSKRHSFNNGILNRNKNSNNNNGYHDNSTSNHRIASRQTDRHTGRQTVKQGGRQSHTMEASEEDIAALSKSLPWTFPQQMDVDLSSEASIGESTDPPPTTTTHASRHHKSQLQFPCPTVSSSSQRKGHTEVKKCRKVYGLDNKTAWCTQCKWKKACSRFSQKTSSALDCLQLP